MTGRTHDLAAISALLVVAAESPHLSISLGTAMLAVLANLIGGIAPDIDQPTAPFWRNLPIGGVVGRVIDGLLGGHRFLTHSLIGVSLLFGLGGYELLRFLHPIMPGINNVVVWQAFMIGVFSHLVMDTFTKEGVPWLLPIPVKFGLPPFKSLRISAGKAVELYIIFPAMMIFDVLFFRAHYAVLLAFFHHKVT